MNIESFTFFSTSIAVASYFLSCGNVLNPHFCEKFSSFITNCDKGFKMILSVNITDVFYFILSSTIPNYHCCHKCTISRPIVIINLICLFWWILEIYFLLTRNVPKALCCHNFLFFMPNCDYGPDMLLSMHIRFLSLFLLGSNVQKPIVAKIGNFVRRIETAYRIISITFLLMNTNFSSLFLLSSSVPKP